MRNLINLPPQQLIDDLKNNNTQQRLQQAGINRSAVEKICAVIEHEQFNRNQLIDKCQQNDQQFQKLFGIDPSYRHLLPAFLQAPLAPTAQVMSTPAVTMGAINSTGIINAETTTFHNQSNNRYRSPLSAVSHGKTKIEIAAVNLQGTFKGDVFIHQEPRTHVDQHITNNIVMLANTDTRSDEQKAKDQEDLPKKLAASLRQAYAVVFEI